MGNGAFDLGVLNQVGITAIADDGASPDPNVIDGLPTAFTVDDSGVLTLTDNGDGTCTVVRATASAGTATVTASVTNKNGTTVSGTLVISLSEVVAAGPDAVNVTLVPGTPS